VSGVLWIITPVYFDVASFLMLRERVLAILAESPALRDLEPRFVVADDSGGTDPEMEWLAAPSDVRVFEPPFNLGHQRALVYALRRIASEVHDDDFVVTMDADGEDAPEDVPRLLEELCEAGSDRTVVLALRTSREESLSFKLFYAAFKVLFRALTGTSVRSGNFIAYRGWVARRVLAHPAFDLCYSTTFTSLQVKRRHVPCRRGSRYAGESRMGFSKLVSHGISMLMPFLDRIAIRALILFTAIVAVCVALAVTVVAVKLGTGRAVPGWATATLLALSISSIVALGNFVVLFAVYAQSRGLSLSDLEEKDLGPARGSSPQADRSLA
jgi:glycosyltransferase involved in cell wall biosynthesis